MTAATATSPRRCGSSKARSRRQSSFGASSSERRSALPRTPEVASPNCSARLEQRRSLQLQPLDPRRGDSPARVGPAEHRLDQAADREDREQGDDVCERLVEGRLVGQPGLDQVRPEAVQDRMRDLVGDDVVRETRVDRLVGELQVAEEDAAVVPRVVGVRLRERVRDEVELVARERPGEPTPERLLERGQRPGGDRVDVLRVEVEVGDEPGVVGAYEAVEVAPRVLLGRGRRVAQVDGWPQHAARGVVVDDVEALAAGAGLEQVGRDVDLGDDDPPGLVSDRRILRHDGHPPRAAGGVGRPRVDETCALGHAASPSAFCRGRAAPPTIEGSSSRVNQARPTLDGAIRS